MAKMYCCNHFSCILMSDLTGRFETEEEVKIHIRDEHGFNANKPMYDEYTLKESEAESE